MWQLRNGSPYIAGFDTFIRYTVIAMRKRDEIAHSYRLFVLVLWRLRSNRLVGRPTVSRCMNSATRLMMLQCSLPMLLRTTMRYNEHRPYTSQSSLCLVCLCLCLSLSLSLSLSVCVCVCAAIMTEDQFTITVGAIKSMSSA